MVRLDRPEREPDGDAGHLGGVHHAVRSGFPGAERHDGRSLGARSQGSANRSYELLALDFPDVLDPAANLEFDYRRVGDSAWSALPAGAINQNSVDLLGLNEGNYEFQARLVSSGTTIRTATGFFRLREPGMVGNLADSLHPGVPVLAYTQQDSMLVFDGLFPLGLGDSVSLDVFQNGQTVAHYDPIDARIDLGALAAGDSASMSSRSTISELSVLPR